MRAFISKIGDNYRAFCLGCAYESRPVPTDMKAVAALNRHIATKHPNDDPRKP